MKRISNEAILAAALIGCAVVPVRAQESWVPTGLGDPQTRCVAVAPDDPNVLLAGGEYLHVSRDAGATWWTELAATQIWSVAFGSGSDVAYAGGWGSGLRFSNDGGASWTPRNTGMTNSVIKAIAVSPVDDALVLAGAGDGIYRTTNGGIGWTRVRAGINVSALAIAASDPDQMYAGTWGAGVWESSDAGLTWQPLAGDGLPTSGNCNALAVDAADSAIVYATFQAGGVWRSFDHGGSWTQITPGFEGLSVALDPTRGGFVYGAGGWATPQRSGCYGALYGWRGMGSGWNPGWFARGLAVAADGSGRVYACGSSGGLLAWDSDVTPPQSAAGLAADDSGSAVALSWSASSSPDCAGYWLYRWEAGAALPLTPFAAISGGQTDSYSDASVEAGVTYAYAVAAVDGAENASALSNVVSASVTPSYDLDVAYISRLPRDTQFYRVEYPNGVPQLVAGTENDKRWPALGETVTFVAHVINKGAATTPSASYRWLVNGSVEATGTLAPVAPGATGTAALDWTWNVAWTGPDHSDQVLSFEVDYDDMVVETFEQNNVRDDFLEGMALDIYVDQAIYDAFDTTVNLVGTYGFEDWIQAQIDAMNANFARSVYPLAPDGCLERVRIDRIIVGTAPPLSDGVADGRWSFRGDPGYASFADRVDNGLIHELMHQLGVIDLYQMPVSRTHNDVVTPDGLPVNMGFGFARGGIMAGGDVAPHPTGSSQFMPAYCSSHSVLALNSHVGFRRGYYGEYMYDVPAENRLQVLDSAGMPAAGVTVRVYQGGGGSMDGAPVAEGLTDAAGMYTLPNRAPVEETTTDTGHTLAPNPFGTINVVGRNATLLVEVSRPGGDFDYRFLNMIEFNEAYWGGAQQQWTKVLDTRLASNGLPRIARLGAALDTARVRLVWDAVPGAVSYRVYRASRAYNRPDDPDREYENYVFRPIGATAATEFSDTTRYETSLYAVAPVAADGTEGPLSGRVFAPRLLNPWDVAVLPNGQRVVLDPQNGYAFLRQTPDGAFIANTGSEHNHVEFSRFIAVDANLGRLLTSHPSDWYGGPHSIRVTDYEGGLDGMFDVGVFGAGPGQFDDPAGVAVDGQSRIYVADRGNDRVQVLSADGTPLAELGGFGAGLGEFDGPEGIAVSADLHVYVCDPGNQRVQVLEFDPADSTLTSLGVLSGAGLVTPVGVAVGPGGHVFVTDRGTDTVEEFDAAGQWVATHATALQPYSGAFVDPGGLTVDAKGRVIVCDTGKRRVALAHAPPITGDLNGDYYVNAGDVAVLVDCLGGPDVGTAPGCAPSNLDGDADVDVGDFAALQREIDS